MDRKNYRHFRLHEHRVAQKKEGKKSCPGGKETTSSAREEKVRNIRLKKKGNGRTVWRMSSCGPKNAKAKTGDQRRIKKKEIVRAAAK